MYPDIDAYNFLKGKNINWVDVREVFSIIYFDDKVLYYGKLIV